MLPKEGRDTLPCYLSTLLATLFGYYGGKRDLLKD